MELPISNLSLSGLKPLTHYGPVTALKFHKDLILCGYGPILQVFNLDYKLIKSHQIFRRNKIHHISISPCGTKILASGGRSFAVVDLNNIEETIEKAINEWIITCEFLNEEIALILTSHNVIYKIDLNDYTLVEKVDCKEKSILYSGSILVGKRVLIAAGTVMDGVIIWDLNTTQIISTLKDHKGSIFGVKIDPSCKYIASCSDDRSIKLYDFETQTVLSEGWGHGSRIWNLEFFNSGTKLISMGEDCTTRVWEYDGSFKLQLLDVFECHLGKHVWSGDLHSDNELAVTGGADGRIILHDLRPDNLKTYSLDDICYSVRVALHSDVIKQYIELDNCLIVLTKNGRLFILREKWSLIESAEDEILKLQNSIMKALDSTVYIQNQDGDLLVFDIKSDTRKWFSRGYKVTNLLVTKSHKEHYVLSVTPNPRIPFELHQLSHQVNTFHLDQPPSFTPTCIKYDKTNNWLFVFGRYATMIVYDLTNNTSQYFKKMTVGDTITSATILKSSTNFVQCLITIRDGIYVVFNLSDTLEIVHHNKISRTIEGGYFENQDLILYGFRSGYFYVWNETKQVEVAKQLCGGGHRIWQFYQNKFAYINNSQLHIIAFNISPNHGVLHDGTHGREVRGVSLCPELQSDGSRLVLTASEDTVIRLGKLTNNQIHNFWGMTNHVSGMQDVKFINSEYAASSAANEEFFIWKIDSCGPIPFIRLFASLPPSTSIPDLRIMDFTWKQTATGFLITTIYSDSGIKIWDFQPSSQKFTLLVFGYYGTCCVLNAHFLNIKERNYLMVGATDGHIAIWEIKEGQHELGNPIIKQQIHQSGIQGIQVILTHQKDQIQLITGGDDNALILSTIIFNDIITWRSNCLIENAASATITSISRASGNRVVVTSVDQTVKLWKFDTTSLMCESSRYTTVADTGSSDIVDDNLIIGGAGLSIWNVT